MKKISPSRFFHCTELNARKVQTYVMLTEFFVSCNNPFDEGESSSIRPLLSRPTEPENSGKWTELAHLNLCAVAVNTAAGTPSTPSKSFKVSLNICTPYCNHKWNIQSEEGEIKKEIIFGMESVEDIPNFLQLVKKSKPPQQFLYRKLL